jgi:hypothetical protein
VDGAGCRRMLPRDSLSYLGLTRNRHRDRKQSRGWRSRLRQLATPEGTSPCKYLVGVHPMCPCHQSHTRTWLQRQLYNPPLLCNRTKSAGATSRPCFLCVNHDDIVGPNPHPVPEGNLGRLRCLAATDLTTRLPFRIASFAQVIVFNRIWPHFEKVKHLGLHQVLRFHMNWNERKTAKSIVQFQVGLRRPIKAENSETRQFEIGFFRVVVVL